MKTTIKNIAFVAAFAAISSQSFATGGSVDQYGCQRTKAGTVCDTKRASTPPTSTAKVWRCKDARGSITLQQRECEPGMGATELIVRSENMEWCHQGKNGGTYTLRGSGAKNYKGC